MAVIHMSCGLTTRVDVADVPLVIPYRWYPTSGAGRRKVYARAKIDGEEILLQNWLLNPPKGLEVDHINGDPLDNRRSNLRLATRSQNMANRSRDNKKFGFRGVLQTRSQKKFGAQIRASGQLHYLGSYVTVEDAARAYDDAARRHHGEFARLNFP